MGSENLSHLPKVLQGVTRTTGFYPDSKAPLCPPNSRLVTFALMPAVPYRLDLDYFCDTSEDVCWAQRPHLSFPGTQMPHRGARNSEPERCGFCAGHFPAFCARCPHIILCSTNTPRHYCTVRHSYTRCHTLPTPRLTQAGSTFSSPRWWRA